jgi:hypothetical protein
MPPEPRSSGANALAPRPAPAPQAAAAPQPAPAPEPAPALADGDARQRLHAVLAERGLTFLADAVENSVLVETPSELKFTAGKMEAIYLKDAALASIAQEVFGRPLRIGVAIGEVKPQPSIAVAKPPAEEEDDATARALANPEVQRFRELFGGEVRKVRNLKE